MISMTQNGDPYENAIAERINGILKTELISSYYDTIDNASNHIARCITIYNYRRRHSSLNWQIPDDVHKQQGPQIRRWKNYYQKQHKNKTGYATNMTGQPTKNIFFSYRGYENIFCQHTTQTFLINLIQDVLS